MSSQPFTNYAFPATSEPTSRTMPARLIDVTDVKDYGAKGDGVTDDWAAIMAAYNHGQIALVATAPSSGATMTFASVPAALKTIEFFALNATNPASITLTGIVLATSSTTVTVQAIAQQVQIGDVVTFNLSNKGIIDFPPGNYRVSQPINLVLEPADSVSSLWRGQLGASIITGNFADYIIKRGGNDGSGNANMNIVENLTIVNTNAAGGGIRLAMTSGGAIRNCSITANRGINTTGVDSPGGAYFGSFEISIENCKLSPGLNVSGSQGILLVSNGPVINCQIVNFETGLQTFGGQGAMCILGCYFERCGVGYLPGVGPDGSTPGTGDCLMSGCWFKNCSIAINFTASVAGCLFSGLRIEGTNGQAPSGGNSQYGMKMGGAGSGTLSGSNQFSGITVTGQYDIGGIVFLGTDASNKKNTFKGVQSVSWTLSTSQNTATFINCNTPAIYTFANILTGPDEGDSTNISNSNSATWGAMAAGGGAVHAKLRYNGSNWTVVGK